MTTSSGTVNQLDAVRIGINGRVLKYRSVVSLMNVRVGELVEYEADETGVWLESIRRIDGDQQPLVKPDAKAILQDNLKAKQAEPAQAAPKAEPVKPQVTAPESLDVITPGVDDTIAQMGIKPVEQVIIHRHEVQDNTRPDSITFGESTKIPGLKIYVNLAKPEEVTEIIDHAFVAYSYAMNKMVLLKEQEPQLFPGSVKA